MCRKINSNIGGVVDHHKEKIMNRSRDQKDTSNNTDNLFKAIAQAASSSSTTSTSSQWSRFKNSRIVRASRTFGAKDRHSKVCTARGLRDRRIRLSVSTAIQLYQLQDRLGLSQPSKVIDWLLDASKLDIDELPSLQFPPWNLAQLHQQTLTGQLANVGDPLYQFNPYMDANLTLMKDGLTHNSSSSIMLSSKGGINIDDDLDDDNDGDKNNKDGQLLEANLMNSSSVMPYSNFYHWDPSNSSSSQLGSHGLLAPMPNTVSLFPQYDSGFHPSTASLSHSHSRGLGLTVLDPYELQSAGD